MGLLKPRQPRPPRRPRAGVALAAALVLAAPPVRAQTAPRPFVRIEAGTLNPDDPFYATLAFGAAAGLPTRAGPLLLRVVRQSRDRNQGQDLSNARTFVLLDWEPPIRIRTIQSGEAFLRAGAGWLFRSPFKSSPVVDLGAGLRYLLLPRLFVVGSLVDQLAFLPSQTFAPVCSGSVCTQLSYHGELQHNIGLLIDLELHP